MVAKKSRKPAKKVKSLPAKSVNARQARGVKGGNVSLSDFTITKTVDKSTPVLYSK
jgi:type VI protein secretion system component Hcp